ncbi:hypothetical protein Tsubulata_032876 [Turnera subulata]|uniref:Agenet domain-containing protein n=1 Tax=Turnera subulata TaxID=218843 RepID=A0A9Q0JFB8_9ROSI|nr:hypothetical protein Tsubulata_032876 [Turnera subulata]
MDYDDNDFQSQNLQLAGEGNNKFPPVLQPYALPKFDFDDNLQGHLRFDSLVETEVFLGIESNEDNQWIEEFSRGSSGLRFSSGAAESCSISRCNNVWSEAASSESVEMLLKSVGQEEVIPVQTNPKELDACDELGCIIKHMEPRLKQEGNASSKAAEVTGLGLKLLSGEVPENFAVLDSGMERQTPLPEDTSERDKGDATIDGGLGDVTAVAVEVMEGNSSIGRECNDANQREREDDALVSAPLDDRTQLSSTMGSQVDTQNLVTVNDRLSNEDAPDHVNDDLNANQEERQIDPNLDANVHVNSASHLENPLSAMSVEAVEKADAIETKLNNMEESCLRGKGGSDFSEDLKIRDQSKVNKDEESLMINENVTTFKMHEAVDSNVSQSNNKNLVVESVTTMSAVEEIEASEDKVDASANSTVGVNSNANVVCSSVEFLSESNPQVPVPSSLSGDSVGLGGKMMVPGQGDVHGSNRDGSCDAKKSMKLPSDSSNMDCEVIASGVVDRGLEVGGSETELIVSNLQSDAAAGNESASNATLQSAEVVSCGKVDGAVVLSGRGIATDTVVDHKDAEMPSADMEGSTHLDKQEDITDKSSIEPTLSELKACTASESENGKCVAAANQSLPVADACNTECQSESHAAELNTTSQKCTTEVELCPPLSDSNVNRDDAVAPLKESDDKASLVVPGESQKDADKNDETVIASGGMTLFFLECGSSAILDKPEGTPTVSKTAGLSQNGSERKEAERLPVRTLSVSEISGADARKLMSVPYIAKQNDALRDDKSFTFEVTPLKDLPQNEAPNRWQPFSLQPSKQSPVVDGAPSTSGSGQLDPKIAQDLSGASPKVPDVAVAHSGPKGSTARKTRRGSGKAAGKESTKKRNPVKETTPVRLDREKLSNIPLNPGISPVMQSSEMQRYGLVDSSGVKPFSLATSTSSLPDLNSASPSAGFHQPFTDLQQVQLRAQIFVYGALIQGSAPDEACMMSAFGGPDGGRSIWDNAWRSCIERHLGKKSQVINAETPVQSRSGAKASEQVAKQSTVQSKAIASPAVRPSSKGTPIVNPMVPLSSPLWSMSTPSGETLQSSGMPRGPVSEYPRPLSPLQPHQTPPVRNYVAHNPSSWMPPSPFPGSWGPSHTTTLDATGHFAMQVPLSEFQLTPFKDSSAMNSSGVKHVATGLVAPTGTSTVITGTVPASDSKKGTASSGQPSAEPKPRKRKKTVVSGSPAQDALYPLPQIESTPARAVAANPSTSAAIVTSTGFASEDPKERTVSPISSTPIDLKKGDDGTSSSGSILFAAREAARKKVEAASAASKRAENVDAIIRAAELAAEAVSQAGNLVTLGDPLSLTELVAAGPEGSVVGSVKDSKGKKSRKSSELTKAAGAVVESEDGTRSAAARNELDKTEEWLQETDIKEDSHVEVFKDSSGFKAAWFSANVLSLKDGKAYVCYTDLAVGEGLEKLKEWVTLSGEGDEAPKIRVARPVTALPGTRKRRRAAMGDYSWSVGDKVDAWIQDSWWEGVITEKNQKDETMLTVHFPVQEETSVVRAWHLRPSLVWRDGEWIEWSSSRASNSSSLGGDTPQEKRQRVRSSVKEAKGKDKALKSTDPVVSDKPHEPTLLELSVDEKLFNIGKSTRNESKPDSLRMTRTGLQKEGSRVVFGVPKPGKKRKFMEVSKHYVADGSSKTNATNESMKHAKHLMPQGSSRGWKSTTKTESNEKQAALPKPKVLRSGKPQTFSGRTIPRKENVKSNAGSTFDDGTASDNTVKSKESVGHVENASGKDNLMEFQSFSGSEGAAEGPIVFSSSSVPSDKSSSKKISAGNAKPERISKGKLAPSGAKLGKIEEDKILSGGPSKLNHETSEPRRSNRRIQPTSRVSTFILPFLFYILSL